MFKRRSKSYDIAEIARKLFEDKPKRQMFVYTVESGPRARAAASFGGQMSDERAEYFREYLQGCGF